MTFWDVPVPPEEETCIPATLPARPVRASAAWPLVMSSERTVVEAYPRAFSDLVRPVAVMTDWLRPIASSDILTSMTVRPITGTFIVCIPIQE